MFIVNQLSSRRTIVADDQKVVIAKAQLLIVRDLDRGMDERSAAFQALRKMLADKEITAKEIGLTDVERLALLGDVPTRPRPSVGTKRRLAYWLEQTRKADKDSDPDDVA